MRKFRFPLERLLGLRRLRTQLQQQAVAAAAGRLQAAEVRLAEYKQQYEAASNSLCQREAAGITATMLLNGRHHLGQLAERLAAQEGAVKAAAAELKAAQGRLVEARRAEQALTRLRERRWFEYRQAALKQEQAQLDEIGTTRVSREVWS